ncbi:HAMP domain-containing protein [Rhodobacterales bacterium]|nr:HAMP domain-containing protein [Rhodobacterales bacterium]
MSRLLKPLKNMRFSAKVGGGFLAMAVVTAAVGAVGTAAILGLRLQSDISAKATGAIANLQQVAQAQEAYLAGQTPELAEAAGERIAGLEASLTELGRVSTEGEVQTATREAIDLVGRMKVEFEEFVEAANQRQAQVDELLHSAVRLQTTAVQITDQMTSIEREAGSAAKTATGNRNRADKVGRMLSDMEDESAELGALLANTDAFGNLPVSATKPLATGLETLSKTARKALKLKVDGLDRTAMDQLAELSADLTGTLPVEAEDGVRPGRVEAVQVAVLARGLEDLHRKAGALRKVVYGVTDEARKIAGKAGSQLGIVGLVNSNVIKFLRASLETRAVTMEFFAGFDARGAGEVVNRIASLQSLSNTLKADSAAFPQIAEAVEAIGGEVAVYETEFAGMVEAREAFETRRASLAAISGEVRNVIADLAEAQSAAAYSRADTALGLIAAALVVAMAAGCLLAFVLSLVITRPTRSLTVAMDRLASGDTDVEIPSTDQRDEIGDMSRTVEVFRQNARERNRLESEARAHQDSQSARQSEIEGLIQDFREEMSGLLGALDETAAGMSGTASALGRIAENSAEQAGSTARASEDASASVENVAGSAEELTASIAEIGDQVRRSSEIVTSATSAVHETNGKVNGLAAAASKIGEVVSLIQAIAEQTNLLALNATIEAARAGDAGKGFAIVAAEVKELATQTSRATDEISSHIHAIQASTSAAVSAIGSISETMEEVNGYSQTISAAVTQQGAATNEISGNVLRAAQGTQAVKANMASLAQAVEETRGASGNVLAASGDLSDRSRDLKQGVETFLSRVAAV